jgi:predicted metal-dependent HD superfamily phosphohydrolase
MHIDKPMNDFVINLLKTRIPADYYYHNFEHTIYVMEKAVEIGKQEQCTDKELELLAVAALWHDTGYINIYKGHEEESCVLAMQYLPSYGYADDDIEKICGMIMATKIPQSPQTKMETIIADADMEYLGTKKAAELASNLFKELNALNPLITPEAWNRTEIDFLTTHHYFTRFCKENRQHNKQSYLRSLINNKA